MENRIKDAYEALTAIGFGKYEARAYCALLNRSPANGYQVAQESGIPRAKIYECLQRLVTRGAAIQVESRDETGRLFAPTDPKELINSIEDGLSASLDRARNALDDFKDSPRMVEVLWRITSRQDLVDRGLKLTGKVTKTLHVAIWSEEFEKLLPQLLTAAEKGIKIALVLYDPHTGLEKLQALCPGVIQHNRSKRQAIPVMGRQFVLVADRERCITGSVFPNNVVEGVFTMNLGLVTNAVDLVNHEIYLERVMVAAGEPVTTIFGHDLDKLDPFTPPPDTNP
ncbi:MAG: TrmB family transcriptional regulator [Desulfobacterales bacterium]|nr:TrmB family transcriptional regulator [Desulfobacterales bacterium]